MTEASYIQRRGEIRHYFDRTAVDAWKRLTSDHPVSRIRATVRAGRDRMRATILSYLPDDLSGWRILDAGCGAGPMAIELAHHGADVTAVDLSPEMISFAAGKLPAFAAPGRVTFLAGDMLSVDLGRFDAVVAMDSLIHYPLSDATAALSKLAERTERAVIFTIAPRTPLLAGMHLAGRLFPRSDRAPAIEPAVPAVISRRLLADPAFADWSAGRSERVSSGFYISQAMEFQRQ